VLGDVAKVVSYILLIAIPIACGVIASLLGFFPNWFDWLKFQLLEGSAA
jgi:hypothetical protein